MYKSVSANKFATAYEKAYRQIKLVHDNCTNPDDIEWGEYTCYLEEDGNSGYAIRHFEDELCFVFSRFKGRGHSIVADALTRGVVQLTCFDGWLPNFYSKFGFVEYQRWANWKLGGPDVIGMRRILF